MHKNFYEVEVGVHLTKKNNEFDCYSLRGATEKTGFAYYDENNIAFFEYEKAVEYAKEYVKSGVKNTYAFIYLDEYNFSDEQIKSVEDCGTFENSIVVPPFNEWLYYIYKDENGNIITIVDKGE